VSDLITSAFSEHADLLKTIQQDLAGSIAEAGQVIIDALSSGHKLLLCGNGGSAADAQHIAAEFTGRFIRDRRPLPAVALTTDTSALTAIGNDFGFDSIFERQVRALASSGDVLIGISTSGNSENVLRAMKAAAEIGCRVVGLTGRDGGSMASACDLHINIPSDHTPRIQEMQILVGHILCDVVDAHFAGR
jgi:D-sedoheptulose 7-phosphate isomerase